MYTQVYTADILATDKQNGRKYNVIPLLLERKVHKNGVITIMHTVITIFLGCIFIMNVLVLVVILSFCAQKKQHHRIFIGYRNIKSNIIIIKFSFLWGVRLSVLRPSVCLSHWCIVSTRLKICHNTDSLRKSEV